MDDFMGKYEEEMAFLTKPIFAERWYPEPEWTLNASLQPLEDGWDIYAIGYKDAADGIVEHLGKIRSFPSLVVYPVLFLYRHYLELKLKGLIFQITRFLGTNAPLLKSHNLLTLWAKLRPILEEFGRDKQTDESYDSIEARLEEITRIDAGSFAFRYPVDTSGQASIPRDHVINLGNVRAVVNAISNLLEGVSTFIYESLQQRWEMEAEYRDEMAAEYRAEMEAEYRDEMAALYRDEIEADHE